MFFVEIKIQTQDLSLLRQIDLLLHYGGTAATFDETNIYYYTAT